MTFKSTDFLGAIPAHNGETAYNPGDLVYSPNNFQTYRRKTAAGPGVVVTNKGFESGASGWGTPTSGCAIENDPANARTGSWVFRISRTAAVPATVIESTPRVVAFPGQVFRVSAWMKCNALANANAQLRVIYRRSDGSFVFADVISFTPAECVSGYVQKTLTVTAPALTELVNIQIYENGMSAGSWWVDDIDLVQVEPESDLVNWAPIGNSSPIVRTEYTSGTGTHTFNPATRTVRYVLVGGGGGGSRPITSSDGGAGGGGGQTIVGELSPAGSLATAVTYVVGAAGVGATSNGTVGTAGSNTTFGPLLAGGGQGGPESLGGGADTSTTVGQFPGFAGGGGGDGGSTGANAGRAGRAAGYMRAGSTTNTIGALSSGGAAGTQAGGGGGGSSALGRGGNGGAGGGTTGTAGANATGYGGGGGGGGSATTTTGNGGNGTGGYILIEEFA